MLSFRCCRERCCLSRGAGIGFTLAEVLITLGIIGVVAAITIPNLIGNYQKQVTVNKLKAAYKIFSDAFQQAMVDYDDGSMLLPDDIFENSTSNTAIISSKYIEPYISGIKLCQNIYKERYVKIYNVNKSTTYSQHPSDELCLPNGISYYFYHHPTGYTTFTIDLNGFKGPNILGRDIFIFDMTNNNDYYNGAYHGITLPHPYIEGSFSAFGKTIDGNCNKNSTDKDNGYTCASKIILDGWQIAPDYPW